MAGSLCNEERKRLLAEKGLGDAFRVHAAESLKLGNAALMDKTVRYADAQDVMRIMMPGSELADGRIKASFQDPVFERDNTRVFFKNLLKQSFVQGFQVNHIVEPELFFRALAFGQFYGFEAVVADMPEGDNGSLLSLFQADAFSYRLDFQWCFPPRSDASSSRVAYYKWQSGFG